MTEEETVDQLELRITDRRMQQTTEESTINVDSITGSSMISNQTIARPPALGKSSFTVGLLIIQLEE